jgi:AcrR family transcriptional regulator
MAGNGVSSALDMQLAPPPVTEPSDRQARRRRQTRARLVGAAAVLFARQSVDNTRINEITDQADVGFGSFYNHFKSKEEIVEAVLTETLAAQGAAVAALTTGLADPAEVVAVAHRHFVELARTDPDWAWLLIRLDVSQKLTLGALGPFAEQDIAAGIKEGRFRVANRRIAMLDAGGALLAVMREVLDGRAPKDAGRLHAEGVLRLLGLKPEDAVEVARRPMPAMPNDR